MVSAADEFLYEVVNEESILRVGAEEDIGAKYWEEMMEYSKKAPIVISLNSTWSIYTKKSKKKIGILFKRVTLLWNTLKKPFPVRTYNYIYHDWDLKPKVINDWIAEHVLVTPLNRVGKYRAILFFIYERKLLLGYFNMYGEGHPDCILRDFFYRLLKRKIVSNFDPSKFSDCTSPFIKSRADPKLYYLSDYPIYWNEKSESKTEFNLIVS